MQSARTYIQNELSDKTAQKIISKFKLFRRIKEHENVLAIFGSTLLYSVDNSIVSTEDRLEYGFYPNIMSTYSRVSIPYSEIEKIDMRIENTSHLIFITTLNKETIRINIKSAENEVSKFYYFINNYKSPVKQAVSFHTIVVKCPTCGATNKVSNGSIGKCEYCDSFLQG